MSVPRLHEREPRFAERNTLLHALLGLVSFGRRFERVVRRLAPEPCGDGTASHASEDGVYLVLGALSLWQRILVELETWVPEESAPIANTAGAPTGFVAPRSLLP